MTTIIKGQQTSAEVRERLKADGRPVALACSLGKDSLAAWVALEEAGVEVVPVYFWTIPNLPLIQENIEQVEGIFGVRIHQCPHPRFFRMLNKHVLQPPERSNIIQTANLESPDYGDLWPMVLEDLGLPEDTWICDGVRACDSIQRRASLTKNGVMKRTTHKASVVADWTKQEVMDALERRGIGLPPDYEMFGRSFDGLDERFMRPLRDQRPQDYGIVTQWFPFAGADILRHDHFADFFSTAARKRGQEDDGTQDSYRARAKADVKRYKLAVSSEYWLCFCFKTEAEREHFAELVHADGEFAFGDDLEAISTAPEQAKKRFAGSGDRLDRCPNPLDSMPDDASDGTVNGDALAVADALMAAFVQPVEKFRSVYCSPHHVTVIFPDMDEKDAFLDRFGIADLGDKYIDGSKAMKALGIE